MFAVPGWSLRADELKTETARPLSGLAAGASTASAGAATSSQASHSRKRKRPKAPPAVTQDNVADLWERVIEHKDKGQQKRERPDHNQKKRQKLRGDGGSQSQNVATQAEPSSGQPKQTGEKAAVPAGGQLESKEADKKGMKKEKKKGDKEKKKGKGDKSNKLKKDNIEGQPDESPKATRPAASTGPLAPPAPATKLTPLQASMRAKLISARFRHLNETLYTRPSSEAFDLFRDSPEMFSEYHEGFRQQVGVWPENPIDGYIADIRARAALGRPYVPKGGSRHHHGKHQRRKEQQQQQQQQVGASGLQPLPRTEGTCRIADLGCGDGRLGLELQPESPALHLEVLSFDLQSPAPHVAAADMASLPLDDGSVNVAIFCLALMGTNWPTFVEEAYRVLHWKGELWVAEIKSRFASPAAARKNPTGGTVVEHSVGLRRKTTAGRKGKSKKGEEEEEDLGAAAPGQAEALAIEVDGAEDRRGETDVSGFVEVLRRRGFVPHGEGGDAVDLSNRMFVKMRFLKAATPTKGKGAVAAAAAATAATAAAKANKPGLADRGGFVGKKKFIESGEQGDDGAAEARVLKPCVYKIR